MRSKPICPSCLLGLAAALTLWACEPAYELDLYEATLTIDDGDVILTTPWSRTAASRDPDPAQAGVVMRGLGYAEEGPVTRVIFQFDAPTHFPGYRAAFSDEPPHGCDPQAGPVELSGARYLVVTIESAALPGGSPPAVSGPVETLEYAHMPEATVPCATAEAFRWAALVQGVQEVRIQELRNPTRLAVEIR